MALVLHPLLSVAALVASPLSGLLGPLPIFILLIVGMYALMFLPQQRKQKQWNAMLAAIKNGDKVTTTGGIRGTVASVKDDVLVIRTAPDGVKLEIVKSAVAAVTTSEAEAAKS